jgi:hypothetical protein
LPETDSALMQEESVSMELFTVASPEPLSESKVLKNNTDTKETKPTPIIITIITATIWAMPFIIRY